MNRTEASNAVSTALKAAAAQNRPLAPAFRQVLKEFGGISEAETAGARESLQQSTFIDAKDRPELNKYLDDADLRRPRIAANNSRVAADQPRLDAAVSQTLREGVRTVNLDGQGALPETFKTFVRDALSSGKAEAYDPRFLRENPIFEDNTAIVGDTGGKGAIISTGVTNPYGGQESQNRGTMSYANTLITGEKIKSLMTTPRQATVDMGARDGKTHETASKQITWDGSLNHTYFEGHRIPPATVGPNGAPWSGHYMLTTSGLLALPYTRMSEYERVFLTTSSLFHENPTYKVLAVGHFQMDNGEVTSIGLSGRMAKGMRSGDLKIIDVIGALKALEIPVAANVTLRMEG